MQTHSTHTNHLQNLNTQHFIMQSVDNNSVATNSQMNAGQYTYRGVAFNNTGKNWRKLITPAHDSFKKLQHLQPEYSGTAGGAEGSGLTTALQDRRHPLIGIGATTESNNTSLDTSNNYSSVQEFNPATNEMLQLKPFNHREDGAATTGRKSSPGNNEIEEEIKDSTQRDNSLKRRMIKEQQQVENLKGSTNKSQLATGSIGPDAQGFGTSSLQMKSLMKSFSNGNFQFYENLHKKYFDKAKEDQKSQKPPTSSSNLDKSEKDLFALTSKTGTILGMSQLKQSIDSLKTSSRMIDDKPSVLRASSLNANKSQMKESDKENQGQKTMSINFKNSLYKKMHATSVFFDDQSQLQQSKDDGTTPGNIVRGGIRLRKDYFDTSSSSSQSRSSDDQPLHHLQSSSLPSRSDHSNKLTKNDRLRNIDLRQRQLEIIGGGRDNSQDRRRKKRDLSHNVMQKSRLEVKGHGGVPVNHRDYIRDQQFDEDDRYHSVLSRRDLSANDDTQSHLDHHANAKTPRDFMQDLKTRSRIETKGLNNQQRVMSDDTRGNKGYEEDTHSSPQQIFPQGLQSILSSEGNHNQKLSIIQTSLLSSNHQDYRTQPHYAAQSQVDTTNIIFEQPTREELGDTYKQNIPVSRVGEVVVSEEMQPSELSNVIDQAFMSEMNSSQLQSASAQSNDDILKTFQEQCRIARSRQYGGEPQMINQNSGKNLNFQTNQKNNPLLNSQYAYGQVMNATPVLKQMSSDKESIPRAINQINKANMIMQSAAPITRQNNLASGQRGAANIQTTNTKRGIPHMLHASSGPALYHQTDQGGIFGFQGDQRSDFTFVLSNPTDFNMECGCTAQQQQVVDSSFLTQKHQRLLGTSTSNQNIHSGGGRRKNRLPEIVGASPIYSESGMLPPRDVQMVQQCQNCGGCKGASTGGNRQNQIVRMSYNQESIKEESQDEDDEAAVFVNQNKQHQPQISTSKKVFDYNTHYPEKSGPSTAVKSGQADIVSSSNKGGNVEEELRFLRLLLQVSQEYMTKMLSEDSGLQPAFKRELEKVLALISNVNRQRDHTQQEDSQRNYDDNQHHNQATGVDNTINEESKECAGNMTMSELQLHSDSQLGQPPAKQDNQLNDSTKQSELVIVEDPGAGGNTGHQRKRKEATGKFKCSLISEGDTEEDSMNVEDTVYSYLEEETEDFEREIISINKKQKSIKQGSRKVVAGVTQSLMQTKKMLKKEKQINRQQQDILKRMQAEIEVLNQRWILTEEKLRSGENMYHLISRTNSFVPPASNYNKSIVNFRSTALITPPPLGATHLVGTIKTDTTSPITIPHHNFSTNFLANRDTINSHQSPIQIGSQTTNKHLQSHNILLTTGNPSVSHFTHGQQPITPGQLAGPILLTTPQSATNLYLDTSHTQHNSSNNQSVLATLNERLTKQIEDNLALFENLNQELSSKQQALRVGEVLIDEKDREVQRLRGQIRTMDENMRQLLMVTKMTTEATEASKHKHREDMDKIRRRQEEYQRKIDRIQSVFSASEGTGHGHQLQHSSSQVKDEELSIGQIQNSINNPLKDSSQADFMPTKLERVRSSSRGKENANPNHKNPTQMTQSTGKYAKVVIQDQSDIISPNAAEDSSTLLKYSQDLTANSQLINTMKQSSKRAM